MIRVLHLIDFINRNSTEAAVVSLTLKKLLIQYNGNIFGVVVLTIRSLTVFNSHTDHKQPEFTHIYQKLSILNGDVDKAALDLKSTIYH